MLRFLFLVTALLSTLVTLPSIASADRYGTQVTLFYTDLAPYGRWVEHRIYGTVWVPASGRPDWHPYTEGRWVWTSDYGWYWDSYEEFGWATYHYGRWVLTAEYGWAWVPDDVWGPAWVDWRYSHDHVGWSPMPPEYRWSSGVFVATGVNLGEPRYARNWVFVPERDFVTLDVRSKLLPRGQVQAQLQSSMRITNYTTVNGRIVNRSIDRARIAKAANTEIKPVNVGMAGSLGAAADIRAQGRVPLYKPQLVSPGSLHQQQPNIDLALPAGRIEGNSVSDVPTPPEVPSGSVGSTMGVGGGFEVDRPIGRSPSSGGGSGGLGLGTGVRLGR